MTGQGSDLATPQRERHLHDAVQRLVTEAFHLGFDQHQVRAALDEALSRVRFDRPRNATPSHSNDS